jgi:hypothetical protein
MNAIIAGLLFLAALAALLLILGLRGRRVGDHPYCRRCGYDLFGNPAGERCSECGADITAPGSTRIGRRRRGRGKIVAGAVILVLAAGVLSLSTTRAFRNYNWNQLKPLIWLKHDAFAASYGSAQPAWAELQRRLASGKLPSDQADALADKVLALQADPNARWWTEYGSFIEAMYDRGKLDEARWRTYLEHSLLAQPQECASMPARTVLQPPCWIARTGRKGYQVLISCRLEGSSDRVGDTDWYYSTYTTGEFGLGQRLDEPLEIGRRQAIYNVHIELKDVFVYVGSLNWYRPTRSVMETAAKKKTLHAWDLKLTRDVEIVDPPEWPARFSTAAPRTPSFTDVVIRQPHDGNHVTTLTWVSHSPGIPMSFKVYVRLPDGKEELVHRFFTGEPWVPVLSDGKEELVHGFFTGYPYLPVLSEGAALPRPITPSAATFAIKAPDNLPERVTLVLRPSLEGVDDAGTNVWGRMIEIPNVPVLDEPPWPRVKTAFEKVEY